jgi:hypothetical protein
VGVTAADAGLIALGLAEVPQIMSAFLPSPSTAYDKASGTISSGPESLKILRRGEIMGAGVSMGIAGAVALIASQNMGAHAAWIFLGAAGVLVLFVYEFERELRRGQQQAQGG